mgnify:FL=1
MWRRDRLKALSAKFGGNAPLGRALGYADGVEFPSIPTIAQQCRETFRIVAESEAEMIKARTEANQLLTSRYCPGEPWCPK